MVRVMAIIGGVAILALVALALLVNHYRDNVITYKGQHDEATKQLTLANVTIDDMQVCQREVAAPDEKYTKELADAKAENAALQRKLDNGGRVFVKGHCSVPATTEATISADVGHDAPVELSDVAGRNVLGIRSGIISDQAKVKYLQQYIAEQRSNIQ